MSIKRTIIIGGPKKTADDTKKTVKRETKKTTKKASIKKSVKISDEKAPTKGAKETGNTIKRTIIAKSTKEIEERPIRKFSKKGKKLIIVESPAKSKTIEKFLGKDYKVYASMGHLRDLPVNTLGVDVDHEFTPRYINMKSRKKVIDELCAAADKASGIYLATDPDREGEAISWHLAHILDLDASDKNRITFNEITNNAVHEAIEHPRTIDMDMVDAQQARRILDRLVGYKLSPLLWKKVCKGLSAGRVQSVAIRLICEREREIEAFVPEEYWSIEGIYEDSSNKKEKPFKAELTHIGGEKASISSEKEAKVIEEDLLHKEGLVTKVEKKKRMRKAAPPFTTSTLQQEGVRKLNYPAKKTMMLAQHLYEGMDIGNYGHVGLITYMRTDSTRIAQEMQDSAREFILQKYGKEFYPTKANNYGKKASAQDAHEAIRPTSMELTPDILEPYLSRDELKLYKLIWNRFLASQMAPMKSEILTMLIEVGDYQLRASGSKVVFKGFTEVYDEVKKEDDNILPILKEGTVLSNREINSAQHFTQPPPRFTEASLIKTLEEKGIGRPSTYAPILDTIQSRNYVEKDQKAFVPTELGFVVVDFLVKHFDSIINENFTVQLEKELDGIAEGKDTYVEILTDFYGMFEKELDEASAVDKVAIASEKSDEVCNLCGHEMVYKFGRFGKFLACSNFPECKNTKPIVISTHVSCPKCGEGEIIERKSKRGRKFYGCSTYPKCDFSLWDKPIDENCQVCGALMVEKTYKNGNVKKYCSNEECTTRERKSAKKKTLKKDKE